MMRSRRQEPLEVEQVRTLVAEVLRPAHFFAGPLLELEWEHRSAQTVPWEIFHGRLLDQKQTRLEKTLETWNIYVWEGEVWEGEAPAEQSAAERAGSAGTSPSRPASHSRPPPSRPPLDRSGRSSEPLLCILLDAESGELHVVRGLLCYVWEGYDAGDNTYLSREVTRWLRELVGTVNLRQFFEEAELRDELAGYLFRAVVGTSRLPLTSVEAPLPGFSLGQLAYFYGPDAQGSEPMRSPSEVLQLRLNAGASWIEKAKLFEGVLRAVSANELRTVTADLVRRWREIGHAVEELPALLRTLFNEVSLSPYTDFADKALAFVQLLVEDGHLDPAAQVDFLSYLVRQIGRHLTAYDLVTFHHRGANYPDALLLDAVLKNYSRLIELHPELFAEGATLPERERSRRRVRRRALRQAWLLRRHYAGLPVPDAPTAPGENARVLPPPHLRVPDEQITQPAKRHKRLYENDPLDEHIGDGARRVLQQSIHDLQELSELRELGMALFIDRPLGVHKAAAEPDQTLLLSYEAFSPSIARGRLLELTQWWPQEATFLAQRGQQLDRLIVHGLSVSELPEEERPVVALGDARRVAEDFVLLRTTGQGVAEFLRQYDASKLTERFPFDFCAPGRSCLIVRGPMPTPSAPATLLVYDDRMQRRVELALEKRNQPYQPVEEWEGEAGAEPSATDKGGSAGASPSRAQSTGCYAVRRGIECWVRGLHVLRVWEALGDRGDLREHDISAENLYLPPRWEAQSSQPGSQG